MKSQLRAASFAILAIGGMSNWAIAEAQTVKGKNAQTPTVSDDKCFKVSDGTKFCLDAQGFYAPINRTGNDAKPTKQVREVFRFKQS